MLFGMFVLTSTVWAAPPLITVFVSILPQEYVVKKIAGDTVNVVTMIPKGSEPVTYEPKPSQMRELTTAKTYFSIGVPFEKTWIPKVRASNKALRIISVDVGIHKIPIQNHTCETEGYGHSHGEKNKEMLDPHIWLGPACMKTIAKNTYNGLIQLVPQNKELYRKNVNAFLKEIDELNRTLRAEVKKMPPDAAFMVFHPAWGYFANEYGLEQIAIEIEGKEPKPAQLKNVIQTAKNHHIKVIFIQPQFSQKTAQLVADAIGAKILVADPLEKNWAENLRRQTIQFRKAVQP